MGDTFLSLKEVSLPTPIPDHKGDTVMVTVECRLCATGTLVPDCPQNYGSFVLIEFIALVSEEKPPVLLLILLKPQQPHHVYPPLNPRFQPSQYMLHPAGLFGLSSRHHQDELSEASL